MTKKQYSTPNVAVGSVKEVEGNDCLTVVVKKGQPFLGRITRATGSPQVARDGPLGEHEAEFL